MDSVHQKLLKSVHFLPSMTTTNDDD